MKVKAYVAEFIGTFALVWVGIYVIRNLGDVPGGLVGIALAHGITIAVLASATLAISGGHLNPAITLGMLMTKRIDFKNAMMYIIVQFMGGWMAAYVMKFAWMHDAEGKYIYSSHMVTAGTPALAPFMNPTTIDNFRAATSGFILEAIATFFLMFAIYGTCVDKRAHKMGGLYIGLAVTMGILAIGPMTGAALNPARWFGPAMLGDISDIPMSLNMLIYVAGPIAGALVAALVYQYVLMDRDQLPEVDATPPTLD